MGMKYETHLIQLKIGPLLPSTLDLSCAVHINSQLPPRETRTSSSHVGQYSSNSRTACRISDVTFWGVDTLLGTHERRLSNLSFFVCRGEFPVPVLLLTACRAKYPRSRGRGDLLSNDSPVLRLALLVNACADFPTEKNSKTNDKLTKEFDIFSCAVHKEFVLLPSSSYSLLLYHSINQAHNQLARLY